MSLAWSSCSPVKLQVKPCPRIEAAGHLVLDLLHHLVVVVAREHVELMVTTRSRSLRLMALKVLVRSAVATALMGTWRIWPVSMSRKVTFMFMSCCGIVAVLVLQAHVHLVVVVIAFHAVVAHLLAEERGADGIGDGVGAHVERRAFSRSMVMGISGLARSMSMRRASTPGTFLDPRCRLLHAFGLGQQALDLPPLISMLMGLPTGGRRRSWPRSPPRRAGL
jgi:hypothetical protein